MTELPPIYDEIYHLLAAQGFLESGFPSILDGSYTRAKEYTFLLSVVFDYFPEDRLMWGRLLLSAVPGALTVAVIYIWVLKKFGLPEALTASCFMIFWKTGTDISQFLRFYALHGLVFILSAIMLYEAFEKDVKAYLRAILLGAALCGFVIALKLQIITLVGAAGAGLWVYLVLVAPHAARPVRLAMILTATLLAAAALFFVFQDKIASLFGVFTNAPPDWTKDVFFYHRELRDIYPTFWPIFPVLTLIALSRAPRLVLFCVLVFTVSIAVQSLGARKDMRFIYQTMPFLFVVWSVALIWTFGKLREALANGSRILPTSGLRLLDGPVMRTALIGLCILFLLFANAGFQRSLWTMAGAERNELLEQKRRDWSGADEAIYKHFGDPVVLTSHPMTAARYLGDFDGVYNPNKLWELVNSQTDRQEVGIGGTNVTGIVDNRHGRPVIGDAAGLRQTIECAASFVFITPPPSHGRRVLQIARALNAENIRFSLIRKPEFILIGWTGRGNSGDCRIGRQ